MCDTNTKQHKNWNCSSSAFFQMVKAAVTAQQSASTAKQIPHHGSRLASHFQEPTLQCRFVPFQQTPFGDSTGGQDTMPGSTQPSTSCCTKARQRHARTGGTQRLWAHRAATARRGPGQAEYTQFTPIYPENHRVWGLTSVTAQKWETLHGPLRFLGPSARRLSTPGVPEGTQCSDQVSALPVRWVALYTPQCLSLTD